MMFRPLLLVAGFVALLAPRPDIVPLALGGLALAGLFASQFPKLRNLGWMVAALSTGTVLVMADHPWPLTTRTVLACLALASALVTRSHGSPRPTFGWPACLVLSMGLAAFATWGLTEQSRNQGVSVLERTVLEGAVTNLVVLLLILVVVLGVADALERLLHRSHRRVDEELANGRGPSERNPS